MSGSTRFNRVPEQVLEKVPGSFGAKPSQVQKGSREGSGQGSGEGLEGFGAEPGQVQQVSGEGSGEGLGGFGAEPGQVQQGSGETQREGLTLVPKTWYTWLNV